MFRKQYKKGFTPTPTLSKVGVSFAGAKRGFTLVETLVAVAILTTAIAGPMTFAIKNISAASVAQDQLVAFELAQEPFEYARNVRDSNLLKNIDATEPVDWLYGLVDECLDGKSCYIDAANDTVTECVSECPNLNRSDDNGYQYVDGNDSGFKRIVKISKNLNGDDEYEAVIEVKVSWTGKYGPREIKLQNNIYKWR
ncbi:TPA: hypothetical protein DEW47_01975 [Patescibacteria group bacterium]|nr:MAG: hypothetical protein UT71_C0002G0053 [Parcubacteria group bacterium GW2011_GWF2_40_10]KKR47830.1 MAG: hypothetical protein UT83_C0003G0043 [Parcubacteria group bacterium GW2011_GWA2_40_143]KKR60261.1 MAG: hypothetical protein UT97_C0003G0043 [Parcubacteria group bacterium GW2011_GWC2_40_31]KKR75244.1 MAG: hypothetical protein UU18_C0010G0020 [Parcubacteria group bacterium GW2011_GWB2_40_8]KKR77451.1 MAG: hypothetical protein UU20_C0007G0021 [Parcubacteria group bacterium GW2011_GWE2_40_